LGKLAGGSFRDTARQMSENQHGAMVNEVLDFILGPSDRSFLTPHS
ncbi:MAG TPA: acyl-[acyl-carrier-protein]--UDP-N-acetylglucosamine O-acyltransferase, partial [Paracoccus sp. (in: a-proteobacteria)]|nr:acyl-[acyl-carrier-protein]--UDP-N-acetylglucosamine O-acyltransferase [Paracoccus sp. (in: a-proteobacteria)]